MFHYLMKRLAAALFLLAAYAWADSPSAVAIRNAKIVTVSGATIAKGTVVLRKGLIEAVGENVQVPADAWVVDGEGMTVYPGLIDPLSTVGIPGAAAATAAGTGRGGGGRNQAAGESARGRGGRPTAIERTAGSPANHQLGCGGR